ncbi:transporter substrate-binding domain-containing protein [Bordetella petrii]|nr:transporter substrate-binding domain-containing protein [Bordetella petrii]
MKPIYLAVLLAVASIAPAHADQLDTIKERGTLICATLTNTEPLGFQDPETRQTVGFDVDTCAAIAKHLGVKLEHRGLSVEARIPELSLGRVDVVAAALGYTADRAKQIDFTASHYQVPIKLLVKTSSPIQKFADLDGKKISATKGSSPEYFARKVIPTATVMTFQDPPSAFMALQQNKVSALALSKPAGMRYVQETGGKIRFLEESLYWEPTALGVKKGETRLLAAVNDALASMEKDGEIDALWNKWYGPQTKFALPREKKLTPISQFAE